MDMPLCMFARVAWDGFHAIGKPVHEPCAIDVRPQQTTEVIFFTLIVDFFD